MCFPRGDAELMPRRRRGGMGWETWQEECPHDWGHGSLKGCSTVRVTGELMPRRRRGGMGWETLASVLPAVARRVGQAIALCGLSCFAMSRPADRRQKAMSHRARRRISELRRGSRRENTKTRSVPWGKPWDRQPISGKLRRKFGVSPGFAAYRGGRILLSLRSSKKVLDLSTTSGLRLKEERCH